jgi:hypothetical protein
MFEAGFSPRSVGSNLTLAYSQEFKFVLVIVIMRISISVLHRTRFQRLSYTLPFSTTPCLNFPSIVFESVFTLSVGYLPYVVGAYFSGYLHGAPMSSS